MSKEDIISLVIWTMTYYGSDAGERANPGSKLKAQAEHIADTLEEAVEAERRLSVGGNLHKVRVTIAPWT